MIVYSRHISVGDSVCIIGACDIYPCLHAQWLLSETHTPTHTQTIMNKQEVGVGNEWDLSAAIRCV